MKSKNGFIFINKKKEWTSHDVVAKLRSILGGAKGGAKVGHAGTLDPNATGLLILGINRGTKFLEFISHQKKVYIADVFLGANSFTDDPEGRKIKCLNCKKDFKEKKILEILKKNFMGKILQTVPKFSAVKYKGKKLYELARKGKKTKKIEKTVQVFKIKIISFDFPILKVELEVSSGFYVRSFARDLGKILQTGAYLKELQRKSIDKNNLEDAVSIDKINLENFEVYLKSFEDVSPFSVMETDKEISKKSHIYLKNKTDKEILFVKNNRFALGRKIGDFYEIFRIF